MEVTFSRFVQALRNADVRVSPAETLDGFNVVSRIGIGNERLLRDALSLALAKSIDEKARFDDAFERFFHQLAFRRPPQRSFVGGLDKQALLQALDREISPGLLRVIGSVIDDGRDYLAFLVQRTAEEAGLSRIRTLREKSLYAQRIAEVLCLDELETYISSGTGERPADPTLRYLRQYFRAEIGAYVDAQYRLHVDASGKRALLEAALKANLGQVPPDYHAAVRAAVEKLARRLCKMHRRRRKQNRPGLLDIKRTMRRNVAYDGAMFDLCWRRTKREQAAVYVLCDVSGSVARVARFLLLFLYEFTDVLPNIRAFAFSSALGEVTDIFKRKSTETAVEEALVAWGGGTTDYARAFCDFRALCGRDLDHKSTIIVLGDARNNYFEPKTDVLKELSDRVKQVLWLNPEPRSQWSQGDSEMRRYAPYCFDVRTCNRLSHIETLADQLLSAAR